MNTDQKITVVSSSIEQLERFHIFADVVTNQKEIEAFVPSEGKVVPNPEHTYKLKNKLIEMLQMRIEHTDLNKEQLIRLMTELFPNYNENSFHFHHMQRIWKWYGILKTYYDVLPEPKAVKKAPEPTEK